MLNENLPLLHEWCESESYPSVDRTSEKLILRLFRENRLCLAPYRSDLVITEEAKEVETMHPSMENDTTTTFGFMIKPHELVRVQNAD